MLAGKGVDGSQPHYPFKQDFINRGERVAAPALARLRG